MPRLLFFDTETNGLPLDRSKSVFEYKNNWPDIVSLSWVVSNNDEIVSQKSYIIKPENWTITNESTSIHGITHEYACINGLSLKKVLILFMKDVETVDYVIAHNMEFDKSVLFNSYMWRLNANPLLFWPKNEICTMIKSSNELKIINKYNSYNKYKYPKLDELYTHTFNKEAPVNAHNSERDVDILYQIFIKRWLHEIT